MKQGLADMRASLREPSGFTEADILFHLGLAMATGNSMIRIQMEGLRSVQREVSELFSRRANRTDADWNATIERHQTIYEAVLAGDASHAEAAINIHFDAADIASLEVAEKLAAKE
jgi:GntR family transcriptional repressor for pyruvate dehydrogenase complex